jgi:hypothetical protein
MSQKAFPGGSSRGNKSLEHTRAKASRFCACRRGRFNALRYPGDAVPAEYDSARLFPRKLMTARRCCTLVPARGCRLGLPQEYQGEALA